MGRKKKYHINLTDEEVKRLKATIKRKKTSRSVCRRCQILLDLDEAHGEVLTHKQSARSNGVCEATVAAVILRYVTGGIDGVMKYWTVASLLRVKKFAPTNRHASNRSPPKT